jgi:Hydroxyacylglutathione hydrolase C-terminus
VSVLQSEPVKKVEKYADENEVTTGKFTIKDEKLHNVFMRLEARSACSSPMVRIVLTVAGSCHPAGHRREGACQGDGETERDEEQLQVRRVTLSAAVHWRQGG